MGFTGMDTDSSQDGGKEIIAPVEFIGTVVIFIDNGCDVLGSTGIDRAGIFTPDILLEPALVRDLDMKATLRGSAHGTFDLNVLTSFETPSRISLRRLK